MGNAGVCPLCGGKGWIWTGAARVVCRCGGSGRARRHEELARGPMPEAPDPIKTRTR